MDLNAARRRPTARTLADARQGRAYAGPIPLKGFKEPDLRKALETGGFRPDNICCYTKDCFLTTPDLRHWAQLAWSYLGTLPNGWSQNDEDNWEETLADIVEHLGSGHGISKNEKGDAVLTMVACIAVAKKSGKQERVM